LIIADNAIRTRRVYSNVIAQNPSTRDPAPRRKTVLFCPECSHESAPTGDWIVHDDADRHVYECPVCGAIVLSQTGVEPRIC